MLVSDASQKVSFNQLTTNARADFIRLLNKSWTIGQKYSKTYGKDDARCDFFIVFSELNLWLTIQFDWFLDLLNPNNPEISRYMILTPNDRIQFLSQFDTLNRANYITHAMFEIENFLKSLMNGLGIAPARHDGYYKFTKQLLTHLNVTDVQKHRILNLPAQVRNSLHNNGYPTDDFEITLSGNLYRITTGERIDFAGWNHMYIFFDELLDVLVEIIENPTMQTVTAIPHTSMYDQHI